VGRKKLVFWTNRKRGEGKERGEGAGLGFQDLFSKERNQKGGWVRML